MAVEVKNYDLNQSGNRANLYNTLSEQSATRANNLPQGMAQGVILDARGQVIEPAVLQRIPTNIQTATNGRIQAQNVIIITQ